MNEERKKRYLEYRDKMFQGEDTVESQFVRLFEQIAPFEKDLIRIVPNLLNQKF